GELPLRIAHKSRFDVEPALYGPLAPREDDVFQVSYKDRIAEAQRRPTLTRVNALHLPPADDLRHCRVEGMAPAPAVADGQFIERCYRYPMGAVLVGDYFLGKWIGSVQESSGLHQL